MCVHVRVSACGSVCVRERAYRSVFTSGRARVCIHECDWITVCARVCVLSVHAWACVHE